MREARPSPVFLAILAVFLGSGVLAWQSGGQAEWVARLAVFVFVITGWVVSLSLHEFGHAYLAYRGGDHSVASKGYLTLNPLKYSDIGLSFVLPILFVLIGGIGLPGGAVYVNRGAIPGRLRHSLISAAGPAANLVFAVALAAIVVNLTSDRPAFWAALAFLAFLQVTAAVLNLLPVPGLDGFGIVEPYLPARWAQAAAKVGAFGFLALIALLWIPAVNRVFFTGVFAILEVLRIDPHLVYVGDRLFRFWT
ncbi:site-2 protease family protein [Rhizohabitans arisaemae]|uniref:site-2 protease family protein n=1 Tax=Rhizohabitans arisaemae TaxID=2720610 RepID=UPI0024B1A0CC|nr:site-2 protease family protein [Rhizohabitans arisaemae]